MIGDFFRWQFVESPGHLYVFEKRTILYLYHLFSIDYLFKTLFAPWRKDIKYKKNPSLVDRFQILFHNLISRFWGFVMRLVTIFVGFVVMTVSIILSVVAMFCWLFLPVIIIFLIYRLVVGI